MFLQVEVIPIDNGLIAALGQINNKVTTSNQVTVEEVRILQETRRKVPTIVYNTYTIINTSGGYQHC